MLDLLFSCISDNCRFGPRKYVASRRNVIIRFYVLVERIRSFECAGPSPLSSKRGASWTLEKSPYETTIETKTNV